MKYTIDIKKRAERFIVKLPRPEKERVLKAIYKLPEGERLVDRTRTCAVEIWAECFGRDPGSMKKQDSYDISAIMRKLGGWNKYTGNKNGTMDLKLYGRQRVYVRDESCSYFVPELVPGEIEEIPF